MADLVRPGLLLACAMTLTVPASAASGQEMRTMAVSRQISGESALSVSLRHAAGTLRLRPATGRTLYSMDLRYDADAFEPVAEFDGRRVELGMEGRGRDIRIKDDRRSEMDVALSPRLPVDLSLTFGAGRADVDLGGMRLSGLEIETGASETQLDVSRSNPETLDHARIAVGAAQFTARGLGNLNAGRLVVEAGVGEVVLDLSGAWRRDGEIDVQLGLGALEIRAPRGLGVKLIKQAFLTSLDAPGMDRDGNTWFSPGWSDADRRITVDVDAAFGSVKVVWVD